MPDRALVQEIIELGVETTPGTAVASAIKLSGLQVDLGTSLELDRIAPMGNLWDTIAAPRQEWGVGSIAGFPTYPELAYVFSNVLGAAVVTTPSGGTLARRYSWAPSSNVPWTPRTWTIRRGQVGNTAESASYGLMSGVNMSFSRTAAPSIGGDLFSYALDYTASVGATGLTTLSVVPVLHAPVVWRRRPAQADRRGEAPARQRHRRPRAARRHARWLHQVRQDRGDRSAHRDDDPAPTPDRHGAQGRCGSVSRRRGRALDARMDVRHF
jgi:hypothetical protein